MLKHEFCLVLFLGILHLGLLQKHDFQLPKDIKPIHYDLFINPNLTEGTYTGKVEITVNVTKDTNSITLHSKNLTITDARVDFETVKLSRNIPYDFITLNKTKKIKNGTHTVVINFSGDMKHKTYGFFRGYEEEESGEKIYFGATFFEPINARVAFPCFDEPTFKAQFSIHIRKPSGYIALSNMNQIGETSASDGYTDVHFAKTPLMSSYLVSFHIGNYSYVEDFYVKQNNETVPTRMYAAPKKINNTRFGSHEMPKQLKWFVNYTGLDYMLPKMDYITINRNFHIEGGMEDWGATTSREDEVFYTEDMSILHKSLALNIAHEFGHIWFGNLVTTSSWTEFWLNEGFARFMDVKAKQIYAKQFDKEEEAGFVVTLHSALWRDDELSAKPLSWEIEKPTDAYEILNTINYDKGGSVLRMVEDLIGVDLMKNVMQAYLKKYQYQNVVSQNFIDVLQQFVDFNATDFLLNFIKQNGYPLITVLKTNTTVYLKKERFLRLGQKQMDGKWSVPIQYMTDLDRKPQFVWFNSSQDNLTLEFPKEIKWIKLNLNQTGYYRTNYPKEMWQHFAKIIQDFPVYDRINFLDDSAALVRSGKLTCSSLLDLMNYLYEEEKLEVWEVAQNNFRKIRIGLLQHNLTISHLKNYIVELVDKQYNKSKWTVDEDETFQIKKKRSFFFIFACYYGHQDCREKVKQLWERRSTLQVDLQDIVYINDPNGNIDYNYTYTNHMESLSPWFGANLSSLHADPGFRWPKYIMENCNEWLIKKTRNVY